LQQKAGQSGQMPDGPGKPGSRHRYCVCTGISDECGRDLCCGGGVLGVPLRSSARLTARQRASRKAARNCRPPARHLVPTGAAPHKFISPPTVGL